MFKGMIEAVLEKIREDLGYIRQHCKYCDGELSDSEMERDGRRAAVVSGSWVVRRAGVLVRLYETRFYGCVWSLHVWKNLQWGMRFVSK